MTPCGAETRRDFGSSASDFSAECRETRMSPDDPVGSGSWPPHDPTAVPPPPPPGQPAQWAPPAAAPPPPPSVPPPTMPPVAMAAPPQWRSLSGLASALTVLFTLDAVAGVF